MRRGGIVCLLLGAVLTGSAFVFPAPKPVFCAGLGALVTGFVVTVTANWFLEIPTAEADGAVKALFEEVAKDPRFHWWADLNEWEVGVLQRDVATAAFRDTGIRGGGGYACREDAGQIVLALSRRNCRRVPAAHELFHLCRDVIHRCRDGEEGTPLDRPSRPPGFARMVREEWFAWTRTLLYAPLGCLWYLAGPFIVIVVLPAWGFHTLMITYC
jgi:hypothetical protein